MVGLVGDDEVLGAGEAGDDAQVGLVAGRVQKGGGEPDEVGERLLEVLVGTEVAGEEAGCTGTEAMASGGGSCGGMRSGWSARPR